MSVISGGWATFIKALLHYEEDLHHSNQTDTLQDLREHFSAMKNRYKRPTKGSLTGAAGTQSSFQQTGFQSIRRTRPAIELQLITLIMLTSTWNILN